MTTLKYNVRIRLSKHDEVRGSDEVGHNIIEFEFAVAGYALVCVPSRKEMYGDQAAVKFFIHKSKRNGLSKRRFSFLV